LIDGRMGIQRSGVAPKDKHITPCISVFSFLFATTRFLLFVPPFSVRVSCHFRDDAHPSIFIASCRAYKSCRRRQAPTTLASRKMEPVGQLPVAAVTATDAPRTFFVFITGADAGDQERSVYYLSSHHLDTRSCSSIYDLVASLILLSSKFLFVLASMYCLPKFRST
jgi:hypothetical protein